MKTNYMNKVILSLILGSGLAAQIAGAQNQPEAPPTFPPGRPGSTAQPAGGGQQISWQKFDLDFRGGTPRDLISAIEKTTSKPLNVIIQKDDESIELPAMRFKSVTVPDLFNAISMASQRQELVGGTILNTYYSFETQGHGEDAIFYFKANKPRPVQEFCKFYQLGEYLQNYSIEDITTAIQTGWKMLGVKSTPQLKFHPETKLLIAVGPVDQLRTINDVLQELKSAPSSPKKDAAPAK
ncbi:MAG TPA: hypothetical protein VL361_09425 [Candidatus Limnocylindrales bacterium]|nr:hypothetical protein [Candidatus Limnocylindrales bacterium]